MNYKNVAIAFLLTSFCGNNFRFGLIESAKGGDAEVSATSGVAATYLLGSAVNKANEAANILNHTELFQRIEIKPNGMTLDDYNKVLDQIPRTAAIEVTERRANGAVTRMTFDPRIERMRHEMQERFAYIKSIGGEVVDVRYSSHISTIGPLKVLLAVPLAYISVESGKQALENLNYANDLTSGGGTASRNAAE